ncbi:hypothetical protein EW093_03620 [Thiospirochaeta perfilievii]|uniref:Uncharacterized protein n=1 Tax=Thiospirochaeta perfilievii TaxID=252967 RepID=A0A5C1Q739_9SPIO|nr:hypothetical protein [Thiospirochaeta perfilievii]QEN03825.1 hypothetical protein EW093_03620 [Thiospirochaeta perfilievii]
MNSYLTLKKILIDSVALYKSHFLYATILIGAVLGPYTILVRMESLPDIFIVIIPIFVFLMILVEVVSTGLISTGYVDREFIIWEEIQSSIPKVVVYSFITFIGAGLIFLGLSIFIIPGILAMVYLNLLKVEYVVGNKSLKESIIATTNSLKDGYLIKILKIYIFPIILQFLLALIISPYINPLTMESDIYAIYPYLTVALIIIFPISICFRVSIYYNCIKERLLNSTNQLV